MDNGRTGTGGWTRRALLAAALAGLAWVGTAFGEEAKMTYRWLDPAVADMSGRSTTKPRQRKVDAEKSEALLEEFGREKMPQAYGRYLGLRQKAKEAEGKLQELFPKGMESDPSGGELYAKMREQTRTSVAEMFQRRDEMCFFWLMREAGVFTSEELAKVDKMERMFHLGPEHVEYPEFINAVELVPSEENELFAEKNAPTTLEVFRSLAKLRSEGAASYNQMVRTAKEMDAARVGEDLLVLAERLRDVKARMKKVDEWLGVNRLQAAVEGMSPEVLAAADRQQAGELAEFEKQMQLRPYFFRRARVLPMVDIAELKKGGVRITPIGEVKRLRLPGGAGMEMVWCPPGSFIMGSPAEERGREKFERQHPVRLTRGFWMAKYEVTQAQWQSVMGNNPMENQGDDLPVGNVSWNDCQEFCKKTGLALPTEAQWQFACRAGSTGAYSGTGNLDDMGWYVENSGKQLHPVGKKAPNAWGLYDMHGNVSEWILDKHQRLYFSLGETSMGEMERDPIGDGHDTCCCGGSFLSQEGHCRSSGRMFAESDERYEVLGFRPCLPVFDDMSLPSGNAGKREGKAEAAGDRSSRLSPET